MLMTSYLQQMKMLADELAAAGHPIDIGAFNASIFNNLGHEYSDIVAALTIRGGPQWDLQNCQITC